MTPLHFWVAAATIVVVVLVVLHVVAYMILVERKVSAYMQDRHGPNRVGPYGLLQPIVDGAKMLLKEDIIPSHVDKIFYLFAPCIAAATAMLAFAIVPFGPTSAAPPPAADIDTFERAQDQYHSYRQYVIACGLDVGVL